MMVVVTFNGIVNKQAQSGESVTVKIFVSGQVTPMVEVVTPTNATGAFTTTSDLTAGTYTAKSVIAEDALYLPAESPMSAPFSIAKLPRTITLVVTVP